MDYEIAYSDVIQRRIKSLLEMAEREGRGAEAVLAWQSIQDRLRRDPHDEGELAYHLPSGIPVYCVASHPLSAYAAIYTAHHTLWRFRIDLMSSRNR